MALVSGGTAFGQQPKPWEITLQEAATPVMENIISFHNLLLVIITLITLFVLALALFVFGQSIWIFALAFALRGGLLATFSVMYSALSEVTPDRIRNRAYVLAELMAGMGFTLAPFAAGWFYEVRPDLPMIIGMAVLVPIILATLWMSRQSGAIGDDTTEAADAAAR
jgi:MFS family permease